MMGVFLNEVIKHFERYCYVNLNLKSRKVESLMFGPPGELMLENLKREWLYSVSLFRDNNVFPFYFGESSLNLTRDNMESFLVAKQFNNSELPFGVVETRTVYNSDVVSADPVYPKRSTILRYFGFFKPSESEQFYCRWQLQRKRWWRKFSNDPAKFSFAENGGTQPNGIKNRSIILAKFPWGDHELETITYHDDGIFSSIPKTMKSQFEIIDGKNKCLPQIIESSFSLDYALWTYLCDAYCKENKDDKPVVRLHKKLAPFKFTAAAPVIANDKIKQILDLSHLIMLELRKEGISCLLPVTPPFGTSALDVQLARSNALAVPYTVILTLDSLQTGIFGLYSRETTLQEQVHLSKIREYGQILMTS